jgi:hypothetical protein
MQSSIKNPKKHIIVKLQSNNFPESHSQDIDELENSQSLMLIIIKSLIKNGSREDPEYTHF